METQDHTFVFTGQGERLDRALADLLPDFSRAHLQRLIKEGEVTVGGMAVTKPSTRLEQEVTITVHIPAAEPQPLAPESIPLDVVYRDDDIIVVNKRAGMVVHPASGHPSGTLVNALLFIAPQLALVRGTRRPGIVHRLDKDTSGLIVVALNEPARLALKVQFQERSVHKSYLGLVEGTLAPDHGIVDAPIGRCRHRRKQMAVTQDGREAQTEYRALEHFRNHTLVEALPITGRTHQIRVHLAFIGHPLAGDQVYGWRKRTVPLKRHFLHAQKITFALPSDGRVVTFEAPPPNDLRHVLAWLKRN